MGKCYRREGVNHLEKCGKLRGVLLHLVALRSRASSACYHVHSGEWELES